MAITYVGSASAASNSVSLPTFQAGDVAFVLAFRTSSAVIPTVPAGWVSVSSVSGTFGSVLGFRALRSDDTTTGTWTNAEYIGVAVYRGASQILPVDRINSGILSSGTASVTYSTQAADLASTTSVPVVLSLLSSGTITGTNAGTVENGTGTRWGVNDAAAGGTAGGTTFSASLSYVAANFGIRANTTFPIIADQDTTSGTVTSNSSSWTLTYPTNIAAGDLLLGMVAADGNPVINSIPSGWVSYARSGVTPVELHVIAKVAVGSETGTFSLGFGSSEQGSWVIYRVPSGTWYGGSLPSDPGFNLDVYGSSFSVGISSGGANPSTNPDPYVLNPSNWDLGYTLWIAAMAADTSRTVSAYPSGMTNTGSLVSGGSNGATLGYARVELSAANDASDASGDTFYVGYSTIVDRQAQSFVAHASAMVSATCYIAKTGSPTDNLVWELQTDAGNAPSGTVVATLATYAGTGLSASFELKTWTGSATLNLGQKYWLVWRRSGSLDASNCYTLSASSSGTYPNGDISSYGNSVWTLQGGQDMRFSVGWSVASFDPGTFTISNSDDWAAVTIAIRPYTPVANPPTDDPRQVRVYRQLLAH